MTRKLNTAKLLSKDMNTSASFWIVPESYALSLVLLNAPRNLDKQKLESRNVAISSKVFADCSLGVNNVVIRVVSGSTGDRRVGGRRVAPG